MDSARFNRIPTCTGLPRSPPRVRMEAWRQQTKFNRMTITMTSETVRRKLGKSSEQNQPAAARNLKPPFPAQRGYGTDPRRQGYVAGEILQKRENFSSHRDAPLTAPVPFRKTRCTSGKGGEEKGAGSWLPPALVAGQNTASKVRGLRPCDPARKKHRNYPLTGQAFSWKMV